ncbi:17539_t:CDS:2 [Acaulospora morrowiae]|uniref:17539_t:CDS:1 n=1 Tax=Acaulospora morrowiae TaxID=94023 RepID=A0A9N9A154_9GLOM|nr:17539_t:CDS:2 [Acaulospora morrowiae]
MIVRHKLRDAMWHKAIGSPNPNIEMSFAIDFIIDHPNEDDRHLDMGSNSYIFPWDENYNTTEDEAPTPSTSLRNEKPEFSSIPKNSPEMPTSQSPKPPTIIKLVLPKTARTPPPAQTSPKTTITPESQSKTIINIPDSQQEVTNVVKTSSEKLRRKQEWVRRMRLKFSTRPEFEITRNILHPDGTLNQDYFRPPKSLTPQLQRKWTEKERDLLIKGIQKYGIGHYKEISDEFLLEWTMRLIGRQNLQLYKDWKGDVDAIKKEYEKNKRIGLKTGMWKAGTLVYDEKGVVLKMIQEMDDDGRKRKRKNDESLEDEEMNIEGLSTVEDSDMAIE